MSERVFKRCGCTTSVTGTGMAAGRDWFHGRRGGGRKQMGGGCPRLSEGAHGSWWYQIDLPGRAGAGRRRMRRGGFACEQAARDTATAATELLAVPDACDERARLQ